VDDEKRVFQRLNLTRPLDGWFGDFSVQLTNVSAIGAAIEHEDEIPAPSRALLRFFWDGEELELLAEIVRGGPHRSGLKFVEDSEALRRHIAASATELLRAQEANLSGDRQRNVGGDETLTAASQGVQIGGYVTCTLTAAGWKRSRSLLPDQPREGFTVAAREPEEQIDLLCRTYEAGDPEARRLTRLLAELSVAASR
jgi:hypothetical protein